MWDLRSVAFGLSFIFGSSMALAQSPTTPDPVPTPGAKTAAPGTAASTGNPVPPTSPGDTPATPEAPSDTTKTPDAAANSAELVNRIVARVDDMYRGDASAGRLTMTVVTAHWTRSLEVAFWSKGKDKSFIRILSPKKEKGSTTLRLGKEMWNYLPKVKRVMKVPSSMMGGAWMGSHFTNDDLVKQNRMSEDFDCSVGFQGERGGRNIAEVSCAAKDDAVVVWGKAVIIADPKTLDPMEIKYYDEDMKLARTMAFSEPKQFGKRTLPSVLRVTPTDRPKEHTEVRYTSVDFDAKISDSKFNKRALQR